LRSTGRAVKASGVYVFGISVLEVVCGWSLLNLQAVEPAGFVLLDSVWRAHEGKDIARVADLKPSESEAVIVISEENPCNFEVGGFVISALKRQKVMVAGLCNESCFSYSTE
jgi:hypothetical protein